MNGSRPRSSFRSWILQPKVLAPLTAAGVALMVGVAVVIGSSRLTAVDELVAALAHQARRPALTPIMLLATRIGDPSPMVVLGLLAAVLALLRRRMAGAVLFAVTMTFSSALSSTLKLLLHRARPDALQALIPLPGNYSFPSGHALVSGVFFSLVAIAAMRYLPGRPSRAAAAAASLTAAVLVGASRVYLGVHWASDVVAGWAIAAAIVMPAAAVYERHEEKRLARGLAPD